MLVARRTQSAEEDLQEIALQIGLLSRRPSVADKIIDELIDQADNLAITSQIAAIGTEAVRERGIGKGLSIAKFADE